jgi:hypothetical protein
MTMGAAESRGPGWWQASDTLWYPPDLRPAPPAVAVPPCPPPGYAGPTHGMAVASLVLSLLWLGGVGSILGVVFGYMARGEIDRSQGRRGGRGLAMAGIVIGWVGVVGMLLVTTLVVANWDWLSEIDTDPVNGICNEDRYWQDPDCG